MKQSKKTILSLVSMLLLAVMVFAFAAGCSSESSSSGESSSGEGSAQSAAISVTDLADRKVELDQPAEKVVLTFNFEEYFAVTGEEGVSKIVGWSRGYWEGRRQSTWDVFLEKFPELDDIPDVGYIQKGTLNVESIISLKPDLVLMSLNDYGVAETEVGRLEDAGIAVLVVDYHQQTLENHTESTKLIGAVMGQDKRAEQLAQWYTEQTAKVTEVLEKAGDIKTPKVYMEFSDAEGPSVYGATYGKLMWGALIAQCGGDNIAKDLVTEASAAIAPEQVLSANPDIVIFAGNQFPDNTVNVGLGYTSDKATAEKAIASYAGREGWSELNAVKNKQMYALYHDLSRHIFDVAGLQYMAKVIHPELFKDLDPDATLKEFHDQFYPVDYTGVWFAQMQ